MLKLVLSRQEMARPYAAPPGLPEDRKAALRKAFDDAWADPELIAEMKARGQEVNPVSGAALDRLIAELYATPKDVVETTRKAIGGKRRRPHLDPSPEVRRSEPRAHGRSRPGRTFEARRYGRAPPDDGAIPPRRWLADISSRAAFTALMMF